MTTIEQHVQARRSQLGRWMSTRRKVYLDTRFWIILRDAMLGTSNDEAAQHLLSRLRHGVFSGRLICPIGTSGLIELMKQPYDPGRRLGTARLIDELSLGIAVRSTHESSKDEVEAMLLRVSGRCHPTPSIERVWTKVAYVLGDMHPSLPDQTGDVELAIRVAYFDHMWDRASLTKMIETMGPETWESNEFGDLSNKTNEMNVVHANELRSFAQTLDIELRGIAEVEGEFGALVLDKLVNILAGQPVRPTRAQHSQNVHAATNIIHHVLKRPEGRKELRSLYVKAAIHAGMRWDKMRKFRSNDYHDFEHAAAALCFCDYFLTERPLRDLVTRPQLGLEAVNGCKVISDVGEASEALEDFAILA